MSVLIKEFTWLGRETQGIIVLTNKVSFKGEEQWRITQ